MDVDLPDLFSRERRWCWAERTTFAMLLMVAMLSGLGLGWWSLLIVAVVDGLAVGIDVTRHRRNDHMTAPT